MPNIFIIFSARVVRSPQFGGGFSQAQASAQSSGFGGSGFSPRRPYFRPPGPPIQPGFGHGGFGQGGYGQGGFGQGGFGQGGVGQGGSISISKSISISRGGASQSSAQSSAAGK